MRMDGRKDGAVLIGVPQDFERAYRCPCGTEDSIASAVDCFENLSNYHTTSSIENNLNLVGYSPHFTCI
jgi:hypothetical protein